MATALALSDEVWAILDAVTDVNAFDGQVDNPPLDPDGAVHVYAVFYPHPGNAYSRLLDTGPESFGWGFQVTCVGGDRVRALWCVGKVRTALTGVRVGGVVVREVGDPGPLRRDDKVSPVRFFCLLDFTTTT